MYKKTLLYVACLLAGFGLANIPVSPVINDGVVSFFEVVGGFMIIIFGLMLLFLGVKSLLHK